jgi:hypothetical protein
VLFAEMDIYYNQQEVEHNEDIREQESDILNSSINSQKIDDLYAEVAHLVKEETKKKKTGK